MARQQSLLSDYISVILRTIDSTKKDPAQLRSLVYELARFSLGKQILQHYNEMGTEGLQKHMVELEAAIKQVEIHSRNDSEALPPADLQSRIPNFPPNSQSPEGLAQPFERGGLAIPDPPYSGDLTEALQINPPLMIEQDLNQIYSGHLLPLHLDTALPWEPAQTIESLPRRVRAKLWLTAQLTAAAILGVAIYVGLVGRPEVSDTLTRLHLERFAQIVRPAPPSRASQPGVRETPAAPSAMAQLGFDLPTMYGVYVISAGKLIELGQLPIKVPDRRIEISAIISKPSEVTVPQGKLSFVVFRRDLVSSAPDSVSVRVVARVMKEMRFSGAGAATTTKVQDQWAVRSNSYQFGVAPFNNNPEMIIIRPADSTSPLPSGRYALVFKGQAYDFSVDGPVTDAAHCLERSDVLDGPIYSECRAP